MGQLYFLSRAAFQFLLFRRRMNIVKDDKNYRCQYYPRKLGGGYILDGQSLGQYTKILNYHLLAARNFTTVFAEQHSEWLEPLWGTYAYISTERLGVRGSIRLRVYLHSCNMRRFSIQAST